MSARSAFARDDRGLGYFELLVTFGKTPSEWGALTARERAYLQEAWNEKQRRAAEDGDGPLDMDADADGLL